MADTTAETSSAPTYMSWATFQNIMDGFKGTGIPEQIDRSVLSSRSGGDQAQFLRTAKSFGLIDEDGVPTDRMKTYVLHEDRRPELLRTMLKENYADVIALGTSATPQMLTDEFRKMGMDGADTIRKAIAFYINAAKLAEIPLSPHFQTTRPGAGGRRSTGRRNTTKGPKNRNGQNDAPEPPVGKQLPGVVKALVAKLPAEGETWTAEDAEWWLTMAKLTFPKEYDYDPPSGEASS
jgi:hypothetical protein